jgi:uncharacterized protein YcfL
MKRLLFIILVLPLLAACSSNKTEDAVSTQLSGPSLVMFYTDN